ncbi:hypothetical protein [Pseudarthrobacter polychromogenes]|uniref:Uncharacterized protein n=1 Tax=Pseudarthrobacter polychromogenes TaxID=1676 RepID=A0ABQ1XG87_9MICC|nr:hypothetical protein [Pseudarthrobacter polychromogenes]MBD1537570.1 hypothetical protein [Arthrobacter sp. S13_S34]GGG91598.1 hypothetical protein GCM10011577_12750 [Pseudarthrobacter polychromogenes]
MTEIPTETTAVPDAIGFGFAEIATLASLRRGDASALSAEALRVDSYLDNTDMISAGASSLVARGLATAEPDGKLAVAGPTAAVATALSSATRRMEISLLTAEGGDSVIGVESPDIQLLFQPRAYFTWWAMAQRPDVSAAEANLMVIKQHLRENPQGGATLRRREDATGQTLYVKKGEGSWTVGTSNRGQEDISETTGLDDAALLAQIRTIRQD